MADGSNEAKTSIDSLVELLHAKGRMELHAIATTLAVDPMIVESWAKVLEEGNLARIVNEVGKMYVEPMTITKEQEQSVKAAIDTEKSTLMAATTAELSMLENLSVQLSALTYSEAQSERMFREKLPKLEMQLKRVNQIYSRLMSENQRMDQIKKKTETLYETVNKRVDELSGRIEVIDPSSEDITRGELVKMRDALRQAQEFESQINLISRSKDKAMETIKKSMEVQVKALEKELNRAQRNVDMQLKAYDDQLRRSLQSIREQYRSMNEPVRSAMAFRHEMQAAKKTLQESKIHFNDEYAKTTTSMVASEASLTAEIRAMLSQLDELKVAAGSAAQIYDSLQKSKGDIAEASKKITALRGDATKMITELNALDTMKAPIETRLLTASNLKKRIKDLDKATSDMKSGVKELQDKASGKLIE